MKNISDADKLIWASDGIHKEYIIEIPGKGITLTNADIVGDVDSDGITLTNSIEEASSLSFVGCISSELKFSCADLEENLIGERITVTVSAEGVSTPLKIFTGIIETVSNENHEDVVTEITAHDDMARINNTNYVDWYKGLSLPVSMHYFLDAFAHEAGIEIESADLIFDSMRVERTIDAESLTGYDILSRLCQLNAVFAWINGEGILKFIKLDVPDTALLPSNTLYPSNTLFPMDGSGSGMQAHKLIYESVKYENYNVKKIDKVQVREDYADIGAISGTGTNAYVIEDNFYVYGKNAAQLAEIADRIYAEVSKIEFQPYELKGPGLLYLEPGDCISFATEKNLVSSYILSRTLKGMQGLTDDFSAKSEEERGTQVLGLNSEITKLMGKANRLERNVERTMSEIYNEDGSSKIEQQAQEISAKVSQQGGNTSFSWKLLPDGFELKAGNTVVFRCDKNGITVNGYATAAQINAANAEITKLYANEATLGDLISDRATTEQLNATNANVGTLSTNVANLGNAVSNKLTTSELSSAISALSYVTAKSVHCSSYMVNYGGKSWTISPTQLAIGGSQYVLLAARYTG